MTDTITTYAGEIVEYSPTAAALAELRDKFANVIFPVETKTGMKDAKEVRQKLVKLRTGLETQRKELKEPALRRCQSIDAEAKEITTAIKAIEEPIDAQIKAEEARIEAEKQAKAKREAEIKEKVAGIRALPLQLAYASADEIAAERGALFAFDPPEDVFGEFTDECKAALSEAITALDDLHDKAVVRETAAAELAAEQAKLDAERAAFEAERAAYEAEKRAFEAQRAQETPAPSGLQTAPAEPEQQPEIVADVMPEVVVTPEQAAAIFKEEQPSISEWKIRRLSIATADQFHALSLKVGVVGFAEFAQELDVVADTLRSGQYDAALASCDHEALVAADTTLIDATVNAIDTLTEQKEAA